MNPGISSHHPSIQYYDSDYPSPFDTRFPENFDSVTEYQGLAFDIDRYRELVSEFGGPVVELCCGTGRVAIPLARDGFEVTGIDFSSAMLQKFRQSLEREDESVAGRIRLVEQDLTKLPHAEKRFQTAILAFNSLLCIPDFDGQCAALHAISNQLPRSGKLLIDIVNPLQLKIEGNAVPTPFFTRKNTNNGNVYTRFAMMGPFDADHKQELYGWYDEILPDGSVRRLHYSLYWRPIFRFEIEFMLRDAGFQILRIEGGHRKEPYTAQSPRMFLIAEKK
jgi:SAM-dependent methyltransferase